MLAGAATLVFGALLIIGSFLKALRETGKWGKQGRELHKVKVALENYEEQAEQDAEVYEELDQTHEGTSASTDRNIPDIGGCDAGKTGSLLAAGTEAFAGISAAESGVREPEKCFERCEGNLSVLFK